MCKLVANAVCCAVCESIKNALCGTVVELIGMLCVSLPENLCVVQCMSLFEILCVTLCVSLSLLRNLLVTLGNLDYFMCQKAFHIIYEIIAKPYQNLSILKILIVFCLNIRTDRVA